MKVLADTSVWIEHFRTPSDHLPELIASARLQLHPHVIAELALGSVPDRARLLVTLAALPAIEPAANEALLDFIADSELQSKGIGYVDVQLLKGCADNQVHLWTRDKHLAAQAERLGLAYTP